MIPKPRVWTSTSTEKCYIDGIKHVKRSREASERSIKPRPSAANIGVPLCSSAITALVIFVWIKRGWNFIAKFHSKLPFSTLVGYICADRAFPAKDFFANFSAGFMLFHHSFGFSISLCSQLKKFTKLTSSEFVATHRLDLQVACKNIG